MKNLKTYKLMRKWWGEWKLVVIFGVVILGVFLGLRLFRLTESVPIFADEAIYLRWAQVMRNEPTLRFLPLSDGKQPLFMWATMFLMRDGWDPLLVGRLVSVGAGLMGLMGVFLLSYRLFGDKRVGLAASAFVAVVPYTIFFDRMGLVDSLLSALGVWALYFTVVAVESLSFGAAFLGGAVLGAAWLTKSPAVFFVGLVPTTIIFAKWPKGGEEKVWRMGKILGLWVAIWGIALLLYNIQRLGPNFELLSSRNWDYVFPLSHLWTNPKDPFIFHIPEIWNWNLALLTPLIFILVAVGVGLGVWKREVKVGWLLMVVMVPFLVQAMYAKVFTTRYLLFSVPYLLIVAAWGLVKVAEWRRVRGGVMAGLVVVAMIPALQFSGVMVVNPELTNLPSEMRSGYLEKWTAGTGIREVAGYIRERQLLTERQIVVGTEGFFGTLPDGLQLYLNQLPRVTVIGIGLGIDRVKEELVAAKRAGDEVYLVVNSSRLTGDPEKMGVNLVKAYPKAWQENGSREELLFFEVTDKVLQ